MSIESQGKEQNLLFSSGLDNLALLPERAASQVEAETSRVLRESEISDKTNETACKDIVFHDTIKAIKRSLASRGSSHHKLSIVNFSCIEQDKTGEIQFKTTPYRWFMLFLFCLIVNNTLMAQVGFSAFVSQITAAYGVSQWHVTLLITSPTILFAPVTYVTTVLMSGWKSHNVLKLAAVCQLLGGWLRVLSFIWGDGQFWLLQLGTTIFFFSGPISLNSISLIANLWFSDNERARATAIGSLMVPMGCLVGLAMTGLLAAGVEATDQSLCMQTFKQIVYAQNGICTISCTLFIFFFKEKPETPPSKLALVVRQLNKQGIYEDIANLFKNRNFILLLVAFTILWGNYITFRNVLTPLFASQFNSAEITIIGIIFVVFGAVACYIVGAFIDKTKKFVFTVRFICFALLVVYAAGLLILPIGNFWITCSFAMLAGAANVPILPASYQYASTLTRRTPPTVTNGIMMSFAQTCSFASSIGIIQVLSFGQDFGVAFMAATILVALICVIFVKAEDERHTDLKCSVLTNEDDEVEDDEEGNGKTTFESFGDLESQYSIFQA